MKILVLAGGESNEREVSLTSGAAICKTLGRLGHQVTALDPATGRSLLSSDGQFLSESGAVSCSTEVLISSLTSGLVDTDLVFIALHGGSGENGSIQNLLDLAGMKYTGSGMMASVVAMNKALTKRLMASVDVLTPEWELFQFGRMSEIGDVANRIKSRFDPPLIIKPNDGGSTIGLSKVEHRDDILGAIKIAGRETRSILVERYLPGRELTVAVFDSRAYPLVEIKPKNGLYDYTAKYTPGQSEYIAPAKLEANLTIEMQKAAVRIYKTIGCTGLARVDFILDSDGQTYCLEVNTLPGMTELSLVPMALKCEGIGFDQLVQMIIESALGDKAC